MLHRKTIVSTQLITILKDSHQPLSVNQLMTELRKHQLTPTKTTIYRILEKLKTNKEVIEIKTSHGTSYYEYATHQHHHHHFICNSCDVVYCLDQCHLETNKMNTQALLPNNNFIVQSHEFNLHGICGSCATN